MHCKDEQTDVAASVHLFLEPQILHFTIFQRAKSSVHSIFQYFIIPYGSINDSCQE